MNKKPQFWLSLLGCSLAFSGLNAILNSTSAHAISFVNTIAIPGDTIDLTPLNGGSGGANINRLGMFSDLYYDPYNNAYYGLSDRGPGGGVIDYKTRVQKFTLDVNPTTGAISNFQIKQTIPFTKDGKNFNGLNPKLLNGNASTLGLSLNPEGFMVAPNGNFYVSDEYGPSVYEFRPNGSFVRAFEIPENIIPKEANGTPNYADGRPTITSGRQDNRGFEGVTLSPDGSKLFAMLQDPLVNEGSPDGRYSPNLRIVEFDTATGKSTAQYIYPLEPLEGTTGINSRVPSDPFGPSSQGRNIGISAIVAINDKEFLVIERDNRGFGVDALAALAEDPTDTPLPVSTKRVYKISLMDATDVSSISLAGTNTLPTSIKPVSKTLFLDIATALSPDNPPDWTKIAEKMEGLAIGPQLSDGSYALLIGTDNDFSVTQDSDTTIQSDVCSSADGSVASLVPINSGCPEGQSLIPGFLYSFNVSSEDLGNYIPPQKKVPEPTAFAGLMLVSLSSLWLKRHKKSKA